MDGIPRIECLITSYILLCSILASCSLLLRKPRRFLTKSQCFILICLSIVFQDQIYADGGIIEGCCSMLSLLGTLDAESDASRWLNCIGLSEFVVDEARRRRLRQSELLDWDSSNLAEFLTASKIDSWRILRCRNVTSEAIIPAPSPPFTADDLKLHATIDSSSLHITREIGQRFPGEQCCEQYQVLYDLRTLLGPTHIQYTEIQGGCGLSLALMLQHPFNTSLLSISAARDGAPNMNHAACELVRNDTLGWHLELEDRPAADSSLLRDLHEREFETDLLHIDGDRSLAGVAADFYNYHEFVRPGGFIVFSSYSSGGGGGGGAPNHVPAFVDEVVSKLVIHGWRYFDVWGPFPRPPADADADGAWCGSPRAFVLRRAPEATDNPFISHFSIKFHGRRWAQQMGISRSPAPPESGATPASAEAGGVGGAAGAIHFAVVMSFFAREFDPLFIIPERLSLASLAAQTYPHWTLVAVGDGLAATAAARLLSAVARAGIPAERLRFTNMDARFREERIYRNRDTKFDWDFPAGGGGGGGQPALGVWKCAGTNALNVGLDVAAGLAGATHVARLDEDDVWLPGHLDSLARAYGWAAPHIGRPADFVYTQGRDIGGQRFFPSFNHSTSPEFAPPYACHVIHATTSWDQRRLPLRYRLLAEQLAFPPHGCGTCEYDCGAARHAGGQAVDADMWARVEQLMAEGRAAAVLQPTCDVIYTNETKKRRIKALLAAAQHPDEARAAIAALATA